MKSKKLIVSVAFVLILVSIFSSVYLLSSQTQINNPSVQENAQTHSWVPASQVTPGKWVKITSQDFAPTNKTEVFLDGWIGCHVAAMDSWLIYYVLSHYGINFTYEFHTSDPYRVPPNVPGLIFEGYKAPKNSQIMFDWIYMYNEYLNETTLPTPQPMNYTLSPTIATYDGLMELKDFAPQWVYNIAIMYNVPIVGQFKSPPHVVTMLIVTGPNGTWLLLGPSYPPSSIAKLTPEQVMEDLLTQSNPELMQAIYQFWQVLNESMGKPVTIVSQQEQEGVTYLHGFGFTTYYYPYNAPKLITGPSSWIMYANTPYRNPVFSGELNANWIYQQANAFQYGNITAWEQDMKMLGSEFGSGYEQAAGDAVGPSFANGIVYVGSDSGQLYAINAQTGNAVWILDTPAAVIMSEPVVYHGMVYVGLGPATFTYEQGKLNAYGGGHRGLYTGLTGLLAVNATDGVPEWLFLTKSQAMPTAVAYKGMVMFDDGDGNIYALNSTNGKLIWNYYYDGSANMASLDLYIAHNYALLIAGFSPGYPVNMSAIVALYVNNGTPAYILKVPFAYGSSVGDAVPAVYGQYLVDSFMGYPIYHGVYLNQIDVRQVLLVANVTNGKIIYIENITGYGHPGDDNNGFSPLVYDGIIYVPSHINRTVAAFNLYTGKLIWISPEMKHASLADQPVYYNGYIIVPDFDHFAIINATNGDLINKYYVGVNLGKDQPVIIGNTIIDSSIFDYVIALPITQIL
jgi:outer membrane protein assembly factor BamB